MTFNNSIFRKLLWIILLQTAATFFLLNFYLSRYAGAAVIHWQVLSGSIAFGLVAIVLVYLFSRSLTRRIGRLCDFTQELSEPRLSKTFLPEADDELGVLARSLYSMGDHLRDLVDKLSLESSRREAILASMVEGVVTVDNELRVTFYNESFRRLVGIASPLSGSVALIELVRDSGLMEMLRQVLAHQQPLNQRLQLPVAEGRIFDTHAAPLGDANRGGAIAILHDVTNLERLERVRKDFVANVSHDLRTPLTVICGYAETLLEGGLEDQENNRRFVEIIMAHANRINDIASDLLTLSELESATPPVEPDRISIRAALETALRTIEPEAKLRKIQLVSGKIEDAAVAGYKIHFERALLNLLQNAVKFNRAGGDVHVEAVRAVDGNVCITIADTGVGIPSDDLSRIFERFYRVDKARSREVGGTGLGLSIVKHVVERMHGTVSVESQLGRGSKFKVLLPLL